VSCAESCAGSLHGCFVREKDLYERNELADAFDRAQNATQRIFEKTGRLTMFRLYEKGSKEQDFPMRIAAALAPSTVSEQRADDGVCKQPCVGTEITAWSVLNELRLPGNVVLKSHFTITLSKDGEPSKFDPTPRDVLGPYSLRSEEEAEPDNVVRRTEICTKTPGMGPSEYGVPIEISVHVRSAHDGKTLDDDTIVDVWQADPNGAYWDETGLTHARRLGSHHESSDESSGEEPDFSSSKNKWEEYECRGTMHGGKFTFTSYLPGHYAHDGKWRPRHIHLHARSKGYQNLVSQVYFHGDPLLGYDPGCKHCNGFHPETLGEMLLRLRPSDQGESDKWSLMDLYDKAGLGLTSEQLVFTSLNATMRTKLRQNVERERRGALLEQLKRDALLGELAWSRT